MTTRPASRRRATALAIAASVGVLCSSLAAAPAGAAGRSRTAAATCRAGGLVTWLDTQPNGAAGTIYYTLNFTNLSGAPCTLRGYPAVSAIGLRGGSLGSAGSRNPTRRVRTVMLRNGATAHADLGIVEAGSYAGCRIVTAAGIRVWAPGQARAQRVPFPFQACSNRGPVVLRVSAVH